jgi:hypothetical protein
MTIQSHQKQIHMFVSSVTQSVSTCFRSIDIPNKISASHLIQSRRWIEMDNQNSRDDTRVDKMVESKLSHINEEQVAQERVKPDFFIPLRSDLHAVNQEIKRSHRANAIRTTHGKKPKVDPRLRIIHDELTKRKAKTKDGEIPLRGVYPLPPGFHEVTNEIKRLQKLEAIRNNYECHVVRGARLHAINGELSSVRSCSNCQQSPRGFKPCPPCKETLRSNRVKVKSTVDENQIKSDGFKIIDFSDFDLDGRESLAPLKGRPHYLSTEDPENKGRSITPTAPPRRRNRSSIIPKKSPLARFKKQWGSSGSCDSSNDSCCSSINSMDDEYLNTPSTLTVQVELDCSIEKTNKNHESKSTNGSDGMELAELALSLSSLVSSAFDNGTFEPPILRRTSRTTDNLALQGGTAARSA